MGSKDVVVCQFVRGIICTFVDAASAAVARPDIRHGTMAFDATGRPAQTLRELWLFAFRKDLRVELRNGTVILGISTASRGSLEEPAAASPNEKMRGPIAEDPEDRGRPRGRRIV